MSLKIFHLEITHFFHQQPIKFSLFLWNLTMPPERCLEYVYLQLSWNLWQALPYSRPRFSSVRKSFFCCFLIFFFFYSFLREGKGGRKGGRETSTWERNIDRLPPVHAPTRDWNPGDWAHNPGMCPDWELNPRLFGLQDNAQPTEPHQPGLFLEFYFSIYPSRIPDSFGFSSYYISWLYFLALCPWSPHLCIFIPFVSCFSHMIIQNTNLVPSSDQPFTVCLSIF